ncbi:MAG: hypothetical protein MUF59_02815 [Candidatus Krumholzibacteria bacterium]|jgi:hypothetical protein|nr:hypothetical protein [Candidatus Krumholzibacteria bacterium]
MKQNNGAIRRLKHRYIFLSAIVALLCVPWQAALAGQGEGPAEELTALKVRCDHLVNYFPDGITVEYDSALATVIDQFVEEGYFRDTGEYIQRRLITTRLAAGADTVYTVDFHPGFSLDPMFIIYGGEPGNLKPLGYGINGLHISFPGDGFFYLTGHTDNCFNQRRKFTVRDGAVVEIRQPFYYVGLQTVAKADFDLYLDIESTQVVGHVTSGTPITVVVNSGDSYLIKTPRDILGWTKFEAGRQDTVIQGIFFFGD